MLPIRLLVCCLLLVCALSLIVTLFHSLILSSKTIPSTLSKLLGVRRGNSASQFTTLSNTEIKTQFDSLVLHNCTKPRNKLSFIERNNELWQVVRLRDVYLFSAFYDVRYRYQNASYHFVRILITSKGSIKDGVLGLKRDKLFCHMWFSQFLPPVTVAATIEEIWYPDFDPNPPPKSYHSYLLSCPVPHSFRLKNQIPSHVSVTADPCEPVSNFLKISKAGLKELRSGYAKDQYLVCVKGMNFEKDISNRIIEWLELNFLLGASVVDFYIYDIHPNVRKVLEYYEGLGKANIIDVTLPGDQPNDFRRKDYVKFNIWQKRRNELLLYNDCLYRNMYLYNFVIPLDIDEVLIPKDELTWVMMFRKLFKADPLILRNYASFSAPNVYFFDKWNTTTMPNLTLTDQLQETLRLSSSNLPLHSSPDPILTGEKAQVEDPKLYMLSHLKRSANFSLPGHSVKSFVSTKNTLLTFNHYAMKPLLPGIKKYLLLDRKTVQLNHYQEKCSRLMYKECLKKFDVYAVRDDILLKYSDQLKNSVLSAHAEINI